MTASLHRLGGGAQAGNYYTNDGRREAKPRNRDNYYARDGDGTWWSTGETVVRHGAHIDPATFRDLCAGVDPRTGRGLVRGAGSGHWAGVDCVLTAGKSVSLLWAAGTEAQRSAIEQAHRAAVADALRLIERECLIRVRTGAGGKIKGRPADLVAARFEHYTTREGDPNLHTHCVVVNVAGAPTASARFKSLAHLTIDEALLYQHQLLVGAAYRAALAERLCSLDLSFRSAGRNQWEVAGVEPNLIEVFSKRSHQVEARVGRDASAAQKEVAALATRGAKDRVPSGPELEARWRREFAVHGADPWADALRHRERQAVEPERDHGGRDLDLNLDAPEVPGTTPVAVAASLLFRHQSVVERGALLRQALVEAGLRGIGIDQVYDELAALERDGVLVRLGAEPGEGRRWTTPAIAQVEATMLWAANRPAEREWFTAHAVDEALAAAQHLSGEQREAVRWAASPDGISVLAAGAGTGKTTAAHAVRAAARLSGLKVVGLAPSWVAANELARSIGIPAQAIAKWRSDRDRDAGAALDRRTVLLVDEAGMASMRDMAAIVTAAQQAGAKLVLLGDPRQLESVSGGSALRAVTEVVRQNSMMEAVRRQEVDWQRAASVVMARGDAEAGLRAYAERGHVEMVSGQDAAVTRVVECWQALRAEHGDDVLVITRRNADASMLNRVVRAVLRDEGRIADDDVVLRATDRESKPIDLRLAVGDVVRFGESLPDVRVWNGDRGTVEAVRDAATNDPMLSIRLEDGRLIEQPWQAFARRLPGQPLRPPRMVHAYAGTAYSVQGRTAASVVHYVGAGTDARETYVALTRHRCDVRIVVERDRLDAACRLRQADPRLAPTRTDLNERLFREASQYSEKANVVDFVSGRQAFIDTGVVDPSATRPGRSVGHLMQAARSLRRALREVARVKVAVPAWRLVENGIRLLPTMPGRLREAIAQTRRPQADRNHLERGRDYGIER